MDSFCVHMPATAPAEVAAHMADAAVAAAGQDDDDAKLRRALVGGGAAKAAAALLLALSRSPPASGVFHRGGSSTALPCTYYAVLAAVALFGGLEVALGFWVAGDPDRRRGWGKRVVWVSVVPLVVVAGLGGFAVLK